MILSSSWKHFCDHFLFLRHGWLLYCCYAFPVNGGAPFPVLELHLLSPYHLILDRRGHRVVETVITKTDINQNRNLAARRCDGCHYIIQFLFVSAEWVSSTEAGFYCCPQNDNHQSLYKVITSYIIFYTPITPILNQLFTEFWSPFIHLGVALWQNWQQTAYETSKNKLNLKPKLNSHRDKFGDQINKSPNMRVACNYVKAHYCFAPYLFTLAQKLSSFHFNFVFFSSQEEASLFTDHLCNV